MQHIIIIIIIVIINIIHRTSFTAATTVLITHILEVFQHNVAQDDMLERIRTNLDSWPQSDKLQWLI